MRNPLVRFALALAVVGLLSGGFMSTERVSMAATSSAGECGGDEVSDWLCREFGEVLVGKNVVRGPRPFRLKPKVLIKVGPSALARVMFAGQASCKLGDVLPWTVIRPRVAGGLFDQRSGSSACESLLGQRMAFNYFCGRDGPCPVRAEVDGKIFSEWHRLPPARPRRGRRAFAKELVLNICATSFSVTVNGASTTGSSSEPIATVVRIVWEGHSGISASNESGGEACSLEV